MKRGKTGPETELERLVARHGLDEDEARFLEEAVNRRLRERVRRMLSSG